MKVEREKLIPWPTQTSKEYQADNVSWRLASQGQEYWKEANQAAEKGYRKCYEQALAKAADCYQQALEVTRTIGDEEGEGIAILNLAIIRRKRGDLDRSIQCCEEGLRFFRSRPNKRREEALILLCLGQSYQAKGNWGQAFAAYQQSLDIFQEIEDSEEHLLAQGTWEEAFNSYKAHLDKVWWQPPRGAFEGRLRVVPIFDNAADLEKGYSEEYITTDVFRVCLDDSTFSMQIIGAPIGGERSELHKEVSFAWPMANIETCSAGLEVGKEDFILVRRSETVDEEHTHVVLVEREGKIFIEDLPPDKNVERGQILGEVVAILKKQKQ